MAEKAIRIFNERQVKQVKKYDYVYIGDDFCGSHLPTSRLIDKIISEKNDIVLCVLTPYFSGKETDKFVSFLKNIVSVAKYCELIVNDPSLLTFAKNTFSGIRLTAGRILVSRYCSEFHSPRYESFVGGNGEAYKLYVSFPEAFFGFLKRYAVKRMEFNNFYHLKLTHGQVTKRGFKTDICYPFKYLTFSRHCLSSPGYRFFPSFRAGSCEKECEHGYAVMKNRLLRRDIYVKGKAYYLRHALNKNSFLPLADRIIYNHGIKG